MRYLKDLLGLLLALLSSEALDDGVEVIFTAPTAVPRSPSGHAEYEYECHVLSCGCCSVLSCNLHIHPLHLDRTQLVPRHHPATAQQGSLKPVMYEPWVLVQSFSWHGECPGRC